MLPLSIDMLNSKAFAPSKDYTREQLTAGRLQLADGTVLIIDETVMQAGQLNEIGRTFVSSTPYSILFVKFESAV